MMKKLVFAALVNFFIFVSVVGISQSCLPEGITFTTQVQINSFEDNYPGCTEILGDVTISGNNITNLNGLSALTFLANDLIITDNPLLINFSGLQNVTMITGDLWIENNGDLTNLSGLNSLTSIGNDLYLRDNNALTSLTGLESLNSITYDLRIVGNHYLTSLSGLNNLSSIGAELVISVNTNLVSVTQLESLTYIGGDVLFYGNNGLHNIAGLENVNFIGGSLELSDSYFYSLTGLDGLDSIGGNLTVQSCSGLDSLTGLGNLTTVGGEVNMHNNYALKNLTGLNNLTSVGSGISLSYNIMLTSLAALESLTSVNGNIAIFNNSILSSLTGLENIDPGTIGDLVIIDNDSLSICDVESICGYLGNPNGTVAIANNKEGCNTPIEIADSCGITLPCPPMGNYYFLTQTAIDSFQVQYPGCTELEGSVEISGDDIYNLGGLSAVSSIGGSLTISSNGLLASLSGLDNLTTIGGSLTISDNDMLIDLSGLQNVITIGEGLYINYNDNLNSIVDFENLLSINGYLYLLENKNLSSLAGLDNINPLSISNLVIIYNDSLFYCEVQSICEYLANPVGDITIFENKTGCDVPSQIESACGVGLSDKSTSDLHFSIFPNPASDVIHIESSEPIKNVSVYDCRGEKVIGWKGDKVVIELRVKELVPGLYMLRIETDKQVIYRKVLVLH